MLCDRLRNATCHSWGCQNEASCGSEAISKFLSDVLARIDLLMHWIFCIGCWVKIESHDAQIIAAPYPTGFNHSKIADEVHFKLQRATQALRVGELPVYGLGHSLGSLIQMLIGATYASPRAGNILMSFNNKNVLDSVPFFAPFIAPGARVLAPILSQVRLYASTTLRVPARSSFMLMKSKLYW